MWLPLHVCQAEHVSCTFVSVCAYRVKQLLIPVCQSQAVGSLCVELLVPVCPLVSECVCETQIQEVTWL